MLIQKLKQVKRHHRRRVGTQPSIPPHRVLLTELQPSLWPSFFTGKPYHGARWLSLPHVCSTLSPCRDSFRIVRSRSNPNLQGSLTGAPFNCLVQAVASWAQNDSTQVFCFPLYFLFALLSFPLHACSYSCVTHCSRLPLQSRKAYLSQTA